MTSYFTRIDRSRFLPTELTSGAWSTSEQHISPMNGLIAHEVERFCAERGPDGLALSRVGVDILGVLTMDPFDVDVRVVRPGRTIELLEAVVTQNGRIAVTARIWRAIEQDTTAVRGGEAPPQPGPETAKPTDLGGIWPGGYIRSVEARPVGRVEPGRAMTWITTHAELVDGERASDLARIVGLVDTANGLSVRESPDVWLFPNLDLTMHFLREPTGGWLGLDTTVVFGPTGLGVTSSLLHDTAGHVGYAAATLTIRPRNR